MLFAGSASAAIGIDQTVSRDQGTTSTTVVTATFSTASGNELLLAFVCTDAPPSGTNTSVTSIAGAGLTWVLVRRTNTQLGTAEIWRAFAPSPLTNVTVTATLSQSTASSMTVISFTGVDTTGANGSGAIGATGTGNSSSGAPTASLVTTRANSLVVGVGDDWDNGISRTPGTSQTVVHQYLTPAGDTYWVQRQNNAAPVSGTSVIINDTAPSTDRYNLSIAEVLAPASVAPSIAATAGTPQSAIIGATFGTPLQATVKDASNNPEVGVTVTFTAPSSGASGTFVGGVNTATTNGSGIAALTFTANTLAGNYSVTASAPGVTTPAIFNLTNLPGSAANIAAAAGTSQGATIKTAFATALAAKVTDASNNPVSGVPVTFLAPGSGPSGTFSNGTATITVTTTSTGVATAAFTANSVAGGPYTVTAIAGTIGPANFLLTNNAGPVANIVAAAGTTPQNTIIGKAFATALQATVTDSGGNLLTGVSVTFLAPGSGASGTFSNGTPTNTVTTSSGVATAAFTANTIAGGYTVTASVSGLTPANFSFTNNPGPAANVVATAGTPQTATINTAFAIALQAKVTDASNNPVSGVQVIFTAPNTGAGGTFAGGVITATTNSSGIATAPAFTANAVAGSYTVTASVSGATTQASFSLTNGPENPVSQTLFTTQTPALVGVSDGANVNYELGTLLQANMAGQITAVRFWKDSQESGTHTGHIWSSTGTLLASVAFVNETASGWQLQTLTSPVTIRANTTYVVSVNTGNTYYVATNYGLSSQVVNGNLSSVVGNNGVYGSPATFPTNSWETSNYFRDVVFSVASSSGSPASITATAGTPQSATINTAFATALQAKVTNASSNPVSGVPVTFLAPSSGASGTFSNGMATITVLTSSTGVATEAFTANGVTGAYTVTASVGGLSGSASFSLTNSLLTPSITSMSPTSGPIGTVVTIGGTNFGTAQGTVNFNGTPAPVTSWSGSSIVVAVPVGAASGNVVVTAGGVASNGVNFTVLPLQLPSQAQVLAAIEDVNNYWIANNAAGNSDWAEATYFTGDLAAYDATGQANYLSFAQSWASQNNFSLTGGNTTTWPDYQAAGQAYIRLYQLSNNSSDLAGITESISGMVNSTVNNEWTWVDAINMSMPNFAELGSIYNNTNYYTKMYALYSYPKYSLGLYDSTTGLWWRDSTYVNTSTYWSRGNGWAFADHAKVLSVLPKSDPHYAEYLSTFTTMAQALAARQQPGGYWNSDLGGIDYAGPESSGTSFFLYGLAWGLNNGILDQNTYLPVVEKAWNFFATTAIQPSGRLGYVQPSPPCNCPGPTSVNDSADYGVGAFLLAARQMALLTH